MSNQGWVKFHRRAMGSSVFKNPVIWYVWSWCLMKASHEMQKFPFNGKDMEINNGQFVTGRNKALKELKKVTAMQYRNSINYLKLTNRITTKATNKFTIISIVNWEQYQKKEEKVTTKTTSKVTNQQPTSNQPTTTYKKVKNDKNDKKLSAIADEQWEFNSFFKGMNDHKRRDFQIMALYWKVKKIKFSNKAQAYDEIKRLVKPAGVLKPYEDEKISKTMNYLEKYADFKWSLETVRKFINEDLEKLKKNGN